jgi:hypothetical protein
VSREDRVSRILGKAPPEPAKPVEAPRNVVDHPLRSKGLDETAKGLPKPEGIDGASLLGIALLAGPYIAAVTLALTLLVVGLLIRQRLIFAEIGEVTCSTLATMDLPENQIYWLDTDPDSRVPLLKAKQVAACADAGKLF